MKDILVDGKKVESLVPESLPMLIHGMQGSGASMYTICLAAQWFRQGYSILFLCGYPMAEEAFANEVGDQFSNVAFYTREKANDFLSDLEAASTDTVIVIVKNVELFDEDILDTVSSIDNLILSGDITQSPVMSEILQKSFSTSVYFSPLETITLPQLDKYKGLVVSNEYTGITELA